MSRVPALPIAAALLAVACLRCAPAAAETLTCTAISALPATISTAGTYCLNNNLYYSASTGAAINITASKVVLDCNDHSITNTRTPGPGTSYGIIASNQSHVTIRNCQVQSFYRGISFYESLSFGSHDNRVEHNDVQRSSLAGTQIAGSNNIISNNRVTQNVGNGADNYTYGILVSSYSGRGVGNLVEHNLVTDIAPGANVRVIGIYLLDVLNTTVKDNSISGMYPVLDLGVYGIVGSPSVLGTSVIGNTIASATGLPPNTGGLSYSGANYDGIRFDAPTTSANHNICTGNVVGHFISNILVESAGAGCVKSGNVEY